MRSLSMLVIAASVSLALGGCGRSPSASDNAEMANATADVMASLDETSAGAGFAMSLPVFHQRDFMRPGMGRRLLDALFPSAYATGCWQETFTNCVSGVRTKTFNGCTIGSSTLDGNVTLTFSQPACKMSSNNQTVTRTADFSFQGPNGSTLHVTSPDGGQVVTVTAAGFSYTVMGLERVATLPDGTKLFDVSTHTSEDLAVIGDSRLNRVVNGGKLVVIHNLLHYQASLTPSNLAWNGTCNCPVSGTLTGVLTGTRTGTYTLDITGCGTANVVVNGKAQTVDFDRCTSL